MTSARLVEPPSAGSFPGNALLPSLFDRTSDQRYHRKTPVHGPERLPSRRDPRDSSLSYCDLGVGCAALLALSSFFIPNNSTSKTKVEPGSISSPSPSSP